MWVAVEAGLAIQASAATTRATGTRLPIVCTDSRCRPRLRVLHIDTRRSCPRRRAGWVQPQDRGRSRMVGRMTDVPSIELNDGNEIPQVGLGVFQIPDDQTSAVVQSALAAGYRAVDTAAVYRNEVGVGEALRASDVPAEAVFVTTKLWNTRQGYDSALAAFEKSRARLGLDVVDLYLIHWPCPANDLYVETWRALVRLRDEGLVRSIGVCNFMAEHLTRLVDETGVLPTVNQVELHPRLQQSALRSFHAEHGIATQAWSPLAQGGLLRDPTIGTIAAARGVTPAQVVLRWHVQLGNVVIPKSVTPSRIAANLDVFGFELSEEDMADIAALNRDERIGPDPAQFS